MTPLAAPVFDTLMAPFAPFEARPHLAVAVSGGRDSLALAILARDWAAARDGTVTALIVDHRLRAESTAEARATRQRLAALGIAAETLEWTGAKPAAGLQQAAREARYRLLLEACRQSGILHLLLAHHAADQSETIAMRAARESGPHGLAGMAALVEHRDARLLRPLLGVSRERLTAFLQARGVTWIEDPSNRDRRFERVRLRQDGILAPADAFRGADRAADESELARAVLQILEVGPLGIALDQLGLSQLDGKVVVGILGRVVQAMAGRDYPPRRDRLERGAARLSQVGARGKSGKSQDFTLCGCWLMLRQEPGSRRLRWIVGAESGRRKKGNRGQPLVPAAFFACGASAAPHVD